MFSNKSHLQSIDLQKPQKKRSISFNNQFRKNKRMSLEYGIIGLAPSRQHRKVDVKNKENVEISGTEWRYTLETSKCSLWRVPAPFTSS